MPPQKSRAEVLDSLSGARFDAVIIGGGINGVAVARDASLRGLSVCLFEQGDFAGGTSSKSTKIAHGGLRYLRNREFGLVRESQRERLLLRRLLPHLATPQSFCYPVYRNGPDPVWKVRLGLTVYDLLAGLRNPERHRTLTPSEALRDNPTLRETDLVAAMRYWDDRMDDARICLETALSAERAGAVCLNYVRAVSVHRKSSFEVDFEDVLTGAQGSVQAGAVVNCGGPWADEVLTDVIGTPSRHLAPTKGVHLVVPRIPGDDALILQNPGDERTFFAIPWDDATLIGTTDTRYDGNPADVRVEQQDIDYLIDATNFYLPGARLKASGVIFSFAGLRPLVAPGQEGMDEGKISRRHRVAVAPSGVVTLVGGKYTTFRQMAEDATDALFETLGLPKQECTTRTQPYFKEATSANDPAADPALWAALKRRYGPRAAEVYDTCLSAPELSQPLLDGYDLRLGELLYSAQEEKVERLDDLILRRTRLAWRPELTDQLRERLTTLLKRYVPTATLK
jgi:glycerol-3-phosphate dehydrogenase